jgi:hypothetical protein
MPGLSEGRGIAPFDPPVQRAGANEAVTRAGIWSAQSTELVSEGTLLATQLTRARQPVHGNPPWGGPEPRLTFFRISYINDASMLVGNEYFPLQGIRTL